MWTRNGRDQASASRDFGMYGTYAADMRYRQERIDAEINRAAPIIPRGFREWVGAELIRLGTRIEEGGRIGVECRADRQEMAGASIVPRA